MASYDIVGNIAIVKFKRGVKASEKKKWALVFLREHKNVRTVVEKSEKFKGRLRVQKTKHIAGERTKEAVYRENNCMFRFNVDSCYFSPRLSSERKEIAFYVKKGEDVLVMFGGVAPLAIVIAKLSSAKRIVSVELGRECNKYARENVKRNKVKDKVGIVQGDVRRVFNKPPLSAVKSKENDERLSSVRRVIGKGKKVEEKFDRIVMARPNLKDSFLEFAFPVIKKAGVIYYYGFYGEEGKEELRRLIEEEAVKAGRKIKLLRIKKAGEIGVRKYRYRVDFRVLN